MIQQPKFPKEEVYKLAQADGASVHPIALAQIQAINFSDQTEPFNNLAFSAISFF